MSAQIQIIEKHSEVPMRRQIVDVRRTETKFFDWVTWPANFAKAMMLLAILFLLLPSLFPLWLFIGVILTASSADRAKYLPYRYPKWAPNGQKDPGDLHPATKQPQPPKGILYFGTVDTQDPYTNDMQVFASADDLTRHMMVLGTTGSGKSEFLKAITFNVLCWGGGFFVSDAKADNKLPTDLYSQARMFGRDADFLVTNFLLGGKSPAEIAKSRNRLSNGLQPATNTDADTLLQMTSNLLVKAGGDGKAWQDRGLNMFRGIVRALVDQRDKGELVLTLEVMRDHLSLERIENLYLHGYKEFISKGSWPAPYLGVKSYLEVGLPGYKVDVLLQKAGLSDELTQPSMPAAAFMRGSPSDKKPATQGNDTFTQHGYRSDQVYPALSLLIDTYAHVFKRKQPEVDMQDVVVNNRILVSLIPSLEKSQQEQESLGKLNLALLRVMMARALGTSIEGDVRQVVDAKITAGDTPFLVLPDELAYQFAEGIALIAAQARSLNICLAPLAQDLEKLTEGERGAEAGALFANQSFKVFMKILGSDKTHKLAEETLGKASVAVLDSFEREPNMIGSVKGAMRYTIKELPRVPRLELENFPSGVAAFQFGKAAFIMRTFYVNAPKTGVPRVRYPRVNRFIQVPEVSPAMLIACSVETSPTQDTAAIERLKAILRGQSSAGIPSESSLLVTALMDAAQAINPAIPAVDRGIALYLAASQALHNAKFTPEAGASNGRSGQTIKFVDATVGSTIKQTTSAPHIDLPKPSLHTVDAGLLAEGVQNDANLDDLTNFDPLAMIDRLQALENPLMSKPVEAVFTDNKEMTIEPSYEPAQTLDLEGVDPVLNTPQEIGLSLSADVDDIQTPMFGVTDIPDSSNSESVPGKQAQRTSSGIARMVAIDKNQAENPPKTQNVIGLTQRASSSVIALEKALGATDQEALTPARAAERGVAKSFAAPSSASSKSAGADLDEAQQLLAQLLAMSAEDT